MLRCYTLMLRCYSYSLLIHTCSLRHYITVLHYVRTHLKTCITKGFVAFERGKFCLLASKAAHTLVNMFKEFIFPQTSCELGENDELTANYRQLHENCWRDRKIFLRTQKRTKFQTNAVPTKP